MTRRVDNDLLLVGSLPVDSTDEAFRAGANLFADRVFALPDGETGPRGAWVAYDRMTLLEPHPTSRSSPRLRPPPDEHATPTTPRASPSAMR